MKLWGFFVIRWARLQEIHARMTELRAENAHLRKGLQSIADNTCCGPCQEARLVARSTLGIEEKR